MKQEELEAQVNQLENDKKEGKKKDKKSVWKYVINISFVLIVTGLALFFSLKDNYKAILGYLAGCNSWWLLATIGMGVAMILLRSLILFCFARLYSRDYKYHQAIAVDQIGVFYNAVTPGASGGEIMQAYTYKKQGVNISSAVSIMAMYSIVFQSVLIVFGLVSFIVKYDFISSLGSIDTGIKFGDVPFTLPIWPLTIIGFLLNVGVILIVLLMGYWHGFHNFVMGPCISLLSKMKIIKDPDKSRESLRISVENFKIEFRRLLTNVRFTILIIVIFTIYMAVKFSIPYFVGLTLNNQSTSASFWDSIFLSNYHQMVTGLIPVPGSAGISEFFFYQLFCNSKDASQGFFYLVVEGVDPAESSKDLCRAALIIWRTVTFSVPLLFAGFVTAFYRCSPKDEQHEGDLPNRQTFVALQNETFVQRQEEVIAAEETSRLSRTAVLNRLKASTIKNKKNTKNNKPMSDDRFDNFDINSDDEDGI